MMFQQKNVVVTGGSRGIGKAIVEHFAALGANVVFTYRSDEAAAHQVKSALEEAFPEQRFIAAHCDIAQESSVDEFYDRCLEGFGGIDVLVNNAGITDDAALIMMDTQQWETVIQTNLTGVFYLTRKLAFAMMRNKQGSIINVSSVSGVYGNAGQCNYAAAKAGIIGFSRSLSKELAPRNIRVNVIAPGFIDTDMTAKMPESERNALASKIGLGRMGTTRDVAHSVAFIASEDAAYITGQTLVVDGGLVI